MTYRDTSTIPIAQRALRLIHDGEEAQPITSLAALHALTDHLHGTRDRWAVLQTIQTIASRIARSNEIAVFELNETQTHLVPAASTGIDRTILRPIPMGIGLIGRATERRELYERFFEADACLVSELHLRACIPLAMDRTAMGAVAIFDQNGRELVQEPLNRDYVAIFAKHAASALYWTAICENAKAALNTVW